MRTPRWECRITNAQPRFSSHFRSRHLEELCRALLAFVAEDGHVRLRSERSEDALRLTFDIYDIAGFNAAVRERLEATGMADAVRQRLTTGRPPEGTNLRAFPPRSAAPRPPVDNE